jgi:uncharacterized protein (TIGR03792 family)
MAKEVWINPNDPTEVVLIIRWQTREHWHAIPEADLQAIALKFDAAMEILILLLSLLNIKCGNFPILKSDRL